MKTLGLILIMGLLMAGCATFNHSEYIDANQQGYATGKYVNNSSGNNGSVILTGTGAGWGGSPGAGGLGVAGIAVSTGPPDVNACNFARSVAMINYSKRLRSVKYDEFGGVIEYEFDRPHHRRSHAAKVVSKPKLPASFGYQPVE